MLFFNSKEVPHTTSYYFNHANDHQQYSGFKNVRNKRREGEGPCQPKQEIKNYRIIIKLRIFVAQMVS